MSEENQATLFDLQKIDVKIRAAKERIGTIEEQLAEVAEPSERLQTEVESAQKRLQEIKLDERRLELSATEKRTRMEKLRERLNAVRNLREEAAVHAEADLVRRAVEADEQEALGLLDLIRRTEERLEDLEASLAEARDELAPRRRELLDEMAQVEAEIAELGTRREACATDVDPVERRLYDRILAGGRPVVVAEMTLDGACGYCYAVIPLQVQNELRQGRQLVRCESCGVILAPPDTDVTTGEQEGEAGTVGASDEMPAEAEDADESEAEAAVVRGEGVSTAESE
jgi:predicted  nucleic acid-binding Zn-ribbon protein